MIGGGDWAVDRIVPDCVRSLAAGRAGAGAQPRAVRPWQHVLEPLSGYLQLGTRLSATAAATRARGIFGPADHDSSRPVRWLVERFLEEWGSGSWTTPVDASPQPHEAPRLSLDSTKARERLGWTPAWDAGTAVRRAAAWYRDYYRAVSPRDLVARELDAYEQDARRAGHATAVSPERSVTG